MLTSASTYCRPFWMMEMRAAGGTSAPLMLDWLMWLSMPNVNAEWENPEEEEGGVEEDGGGWRRRGEEGGGGGRQNMAQQSFKPQFEQQ